MALVMSAKTVVMSSPDCVVTVPDAPNVPPPCIGNKFKIIASPIATDQMRKDKKIRTGNRTYLELRLHCDQN